MYTKGLRDMQRWSYRKRCAGRRKLSPLPLRTLGSGDARVYRNAAERLTLRSAGLHGFMLAPANQKTPLNQVAATILWKWPEMVELTGLLTPPSLHQIPIGRNTKLSALPL